MGKDPLKELTPDKAPKPDKKKPATRRRSKQPTIPQISEGLGSFIAMIGTGVVLAGDQYCGEQILARGPAVADSLTELAKADPRVKRALGNLAKTSTWGGVFVASASLAIPILAHHGFIPRNLAGIVGAPLEGLDLESGGARDADRTDRAGENNSRPSDSATQDVLSGPGFQA